MMDFYTAMFFLTLFSMAGVGLGFSAWFLWKTGSRFIPQQMKDIYHSTRIKLAEVGWGEDNRTERDEYPNRKESS